VAFWLRIKKTMIKSRLFAPLLAAIVLMGAQVPFSGQASALTYDVTFNAIGGPEGGSGSFTINPPSSGGGILTAANGGLSGLSFALSDPKNSNGPSLTFGLDSSSSVSYFYQGTTLVLAGLIYGGQVGTDALLSITLGSSGGYIFTDNAPGGSGFDSFGSVNVSVAQTPLPTSLPLLATGLGILAMIGWWRKRKVGSYLAA
jgi:hypothetical protein